MLQPRVAMAGVLRTIHIDLNVMNDRLNSEGIWRGDLLLTLKTPHLVRAAIAKGRCLLCQRPNLNAAGLCDVCYSQLQGEELRIATRYMDGLVP